MYGQFIYFILLMEFILCIRPIYIYFTKLTITFFNNNKFITFKKLIK